MPKTDKKKSTNQAKMVLRSRAGIDLLYSAFPGQSIKLSCITSSILLGSNFLSCAPKEVLKRLRYIFCNNFLKFSEKYSNDYIVNDVDAMKSSS